MNCRIRTAVEADYDAVRRIYNEVQQLHAEWRPDIYKRVENLISLEYFAQMLDGGMLFVAEADKTVVGVMEITFRHVETPAHVTRDVIFIDTMAVEEAYRGMGVGHLFFEKVKQIKAEKNMDGIELQVNAKNQAALAMYTRYGFTEKSINMELL